MRTAHGEAFLIVDVQNDFCAGGALAVPEANIIVPVINRMAQTLARREWVILASRDWHPRGSTHFAERGGRWPVHCVAGTQGAELAPDLQLPAGTLIVTKGDTPTADGYSAFDGHLADGVPLEEALRTRGVHEVIIAGLATDYCVKHSALDARRLGFEVTLVEDAVKAVEAAPGDGAEAVREMVAAGVMIQRSDAILNARTQREPSQ